MTVDGILGMSGRVCFHKRHRRLSMTYEGLEGLSYFTRVRFQPLHLVSLCCDVEGSV